MFLLVMMWYYCFSLVLIYLKIHKKLVKFMKVLFLLYILAVAGENFDNLMRTLAKMGQPPLFWGNPPFSHPPCLDFWKIANPP